MYYGAGQLYLETEEVCCEAASLSVTFDSDFKSLRTKLRKIGQISDVKRTSIEHILTLTFATSSNQLLNLRTGGIISETGQFNSLNYSDTLQAAPLEQISSNFYSYWVENNTGTSQLPFIAITNLSFEGLFYNVDNSKLFLQSQVQFLDSSSVTIGNYTAQFICIEPKLYQI